MHRTEIFLVANIIIILVLLLCQSLSVRISIYAKAIVTIEYFPLKIILYNFRKRKKKRKKLIKKTKRLLFFLSPILKSARFLLSRTSVRIFDLTFPEPKSDEPHSFILSRELSSLSTIYIHSLMYAISKSTYPLESKQFTENESVTAMDLELTTRLYNIFLAGIVLIFFSIKKKGRNKKIV